MNLNLKTMTCYLNTIWMHCYKVQHAENMPSPSVRALMTITDRIPGAHASNRRALSWMPTTGYTAEQVEAILKADGLLP